MTLNSTLISLTKQSLSHSRSFKIIPFVDGNKRIGHAAMEVTLILNGFEIQADVDEQEQLILGVASSEVSRDELTRWLGQHLEPLE